MTTLVDKLSALASAIGGDVLRFDRYREIAANGTGILPGSASLDFDDNGTLSVWGRGPQVEAYYNGKAAFFPSGASIDLSAGYVGYVVALPDEDTLTAVESPETLNHRIVAWCGYNPDSPDPWWYAGFEMHTPYRNPDAHLLHHLETGMTWLSGGELTRVDPDDPENTAFSLWNAYVADEDLQFTISNNGHATAGDSFDQKLDPLEAPQLYIDGNGNWAASLSDSPLLPVYNPLDSENHGSFAQIADGKYANRWLCFTTCQRWPVMWLLGRKAFNSICEARQESFKRLGLPTPEIVAAYQVIVEGDSTAIDGYKIADVRRIARASRVDDYPLSGGFDAAMNWPLHSLRRALWPEQIHTDATGVWARLGGDITGYEDEYPLDQLPQLANAVAGDVVITPAMTSAAW